MPYTLNKSAVFDQEKKIIPIYFMRFFILLQIGCSALLWFSCAAPIEQQPRDQGFDRTACNEQAGYDAGYNDGRTGFDRQTGFAYPCRHDLRALAWKGYQQGYDEGRKIWLGSGPSSESASAPTHHPTKFQKNKKLNINLGGKQVIKGQ